MIGRWLSEPAPAARLAAMRILVGVFSTVYLAVRAPVLWAMGDEHPGEWDPVGVLWWVEDPWSRGALRTLLVTTIVLAALFAAGRAFRLVGPAFAVALLVLTTHRASGGHMLWFDNLLVLHTLVIGFAPSADAWVLRQRPAARIPEPDARYGWPLRLAAIATVVTYALAGVAKLRIGGVAWLDGDSMRNHVAYSATRMRVLGGTPSPLAEPLVEQAWMLPILAVLTLLIELGAPLVLLLQRLRWLRWWWIALTWSMHVMIALTMFVVFPYPLAFLAFAPLVELERVVERWRRRAIGGRAVRARSAAA